MHALAIFEIQLGDNVAHNLVVFFVCGRCFDAKVRVSRTRSAMWGWTRQVGGCALRWNQTVFFEGHSKGGVAQQDIEKFYDSISLLRVARWLCRNGASHSLAASALRQQMLPSVVLNLNGLTVPIVNRCKGSITGSRVAGALGRVPVESIIRDRHGLWRRHGFRTDVDRLTVATYVDNIYSAGSSLAGAITILEDFEAQLNKEWGLQIKPASRSCIVPRGSTEFSYDSGKWPLCSEFNTLGHILQDNGSTRSCWINTSRSMWKAYFGNCCSKTARQLSAKLRYSLMDRAVLPVM